VARGVKEGVGLESSLRRRGKGRRKSGLVGKCGSKGTRMRRQVCLYLGGRGVAWK